jgi:hypothetical protein
MPMPSQIDDELAAELETKMGLVIRDRLFLSARQAVAMLEREAPGICVLSTDQVARYVEALAALDRLVKALGHEETIAGPARWR